MSTTPEAFALTLERMRQQLGGKNLACWCPIDQPCHADVLLELANAYHREGRDERAIYGGADRPASE
jgi:hypothetical protein